jgi:hypothetical protein
MRTISQSTNRHEERIGAASYDPIELKQLRSATALPNIVPDSFADIAMARAWYQKAKDLGSIEAERRLERLSRRENPAR